MTLPQKTAQIVRAHSDGIKTTARDPRVIFCAGRNDFFHGALRRGHLMHVEII
jgi:hypothetical protein